MKRMHFSVYFKLWDKVRRKQDYCMRMRGSSFGIAVNCDEYAVEYQSVQARMHILDCYMNNNIPQAHVIEIELDAYRRNKKMLDENNLSIDKQA